jgi:bacterioferritin
MKNQKKIIEYLNKDLERELAQIVRYLHHSFIVEGTLRGPLVGMFRSQAEESMTHAIKLGEKITALGGHPTVKVSEIFEPGDQTLEEMLAENLQAEEAALAAYKQHLKAASSDVGLRLLLEQIVLDEQTHVDELRKYLKK